MPDITIDDDSITYVDEKRDIRAVINAKLPPGSMKWVAFVVVALFLGTTENLGVWNMP